ncbi:2-oxo-4-hydroxy-4-carboxy-5-ureidoimidazoline decarboxylase-like [Argopecten irradians]|uniref:2-oxo-4-hydroxy-4-carboxy-5-ureidoimidazoline decarboxylase-like n=1 Tax=Argopecten irradians TaxID=31199 RepID=UPI00371DE588
MWMWRSGRRRRETLLSIVDVNKLDCDDFVSIFGNVVEHCSLCAAAVWQHRPFRNVHHLHQLVCDFLDNLPDDGQRGVIRLFQDIAGKISRGLSAESQKEQKVAGITDLTKEEKKTLQMRNNNYRNKFGFPFVICARKNKKDTILEGLKCRIENDITEVRNGIQQVQQIALLGLLDIVEE